MGQRFSCQYTLKVIKNKKSASIHIKTFKVPTLLKLIRKILGMLFQNSIKFKLPHMKSIKYAFKQVNRRSGNIDIVQCRKCDSTLIITF